jgi:glycosyltransferase involved in cell wall biosynthesis
MESKKRLLIISHGYPPYYGGAEHAAGYLAKEANKTGRWDVTVLTSDIGGRLPSNSIENGVKVVRVKTRKREWARHTTLELFSFLIEAWSYKPAGPVDYILANCALPAGAVARTIGRRLKVPYGVVLQGSDVPGYQNPRFGLIYELVKPWLRSVWRDAAYVAAVSDPLRQLALAVWPKGEIAVIPNGVDIEKFFPEVSKNGEHSIIRLITAAQLIERKGLKYLIEAISMLPDHLKSRISLEICGIGPCEDDLRDRSQRAGLDSKIQWAGLLDQGELAARLRTSSIFVLPTLQEAWPLSLLEAMASGLPVVAARVGGIPQIIEDRVSGLLVKPADPKELCRALCELISSPEKASRLGQNAKTRANCWAWNGVWDLHEKQMAVFQQSAISEST